MIIVRAGNEAGFTKIPNATLRDTKLSWKARGLLCYLLSHETGWRTDSESLAGEGPNGREAVRSGLRELEGAGYLVRRRTHGEGGRWAAATFVYDRPQTPEPLPDTAPTLGHQAQAAVKTQVRPQAGFPAPVDPAQAHPAPEKPAAAAVKTEVGPQAGFPAPVDPAQAHPAPEMPAAVRRPSEEENKPPTGVCAQTRVRAREGAADNAAPVAPTGKLVTELGNKLLAEHVQAHRVKPPRKVAQRAGAAVDELLAEGIPPEHVRAGLALLRQRTHLSPALLPDLVHEATNPPTLRPGGRERAHDVLDRVEARINDHHVDLHAVIDGETA